MQTFVLVALGANLAGQDGRTPLETCRNAIARLDALPNLRVDRVSRWYRTAPVPASDQPDYINAVVALRADPGAAIDPADLLARLQAIESASGRQRTAVNAARTLDLDIIGIGDMIRTAPDPVLPHPRAHQRAFVLAPLADVAPGWVHPVLRRTAAELLSALPPQGVRMLADQPAGPDGKAPD